MIEGEGAVPMRQKGACGGWRENRRIEEKGMEAAKFPRRVTKTCDGRPGGIIRREEGTLWDL